MFTNCFHSSLSLSLSLFHHEFFPVSLLYIQQGDAVRESVRQQFKANSSETDPETIQEMKESALFALENYLILHAQVQS